MPRYDPADVKARAAMMRVFPANNSNAKQLEEIYPGRMGFLIGPGGWRSPGGLPWALDNGRFACWSHGKEWDQRLYQQTSEKAATAATMPLWVIVPDVVTDAVETFREWDRWALHLRAFGFSLALAVQDGMSANYVCRYTDPEVIFVGGSTDWKRKTLWSWCRQFPRVHVGRVNTEKWLWNADRCGAESVDGTGFFRGDKRQLQGLERYLRLSSLGLTTRQKEIAYADGFRHEREFDAATI